MRHNDPEERTPARAVHFVAPRRVELREVTVPEVGEGQLDVRTIASGISAGTEMLAFRGELDPELALDETLGALSGTFGYPFRYGYSCVGSVERSRAAVEEGAIIFAFHPHQDRFVIDASEAIPLSNVPARIGVMYPLVETAVQVCLDAAPRYAETAVVIGLGPVGTLVAAVLARAGARVLGSDPITWRREAAAKFDVANVEPGAVADTVRELTSGRGADVVVEASGNAGALASALPLLRHEGTALVCSWYGNTPVSLPLGTEFHRRRLRIVSTQVSTIPAALSSGWDRPRRRGVALQLLEQLPLDVLATHEFDFEDAQAAYEAVDRSDEGIVHVALRYR